MQRLEHERSRCRASTAKDGFAFILGNRRPDGSFFPGPTATGQPSGFPMPGYRHADPRQERHRNRTRTRCCCRPKSRTRGFGLGRDHSPTRTRDAEENRKFGEHYEHSTSSTSTDYPFLHVVGVSKHRLVATGIVDGPWGIDVVDEADAGDVRCRIGRRELPGADHGSARDQCARQRQVHVGGKIFGTRQVDFAVQQGFRHCTDRRRVYIRADMLNVIQLEELLGLQHELGRNGVYDPSVRQHDRQHVHVSAPVQASLGRALVMRGGRPARRPLAGQRFETVRSLRRNALRLTSTRSACHAVQNRDTVAGRVQRKHRSSRRRPRTRRRDTAARRSPAASPQPEPHAQP